MRDPAPWKRRIVPSCPQLKEPFRAVERGCEPVEPGPVTRLVRRRKRDVQSTTQMWFPQLILVVTGLVGCDKHGFPS